MPASIFDDGDTLLALFRRANMRPLIFDDCYTLLALFRSAKMLCFFVDRSTLSALFRIAKRLEMACGIGSLISSYPFGSFSGRFQEPTSVRKIFQNRKDF